MRSIEYGFSESCRERIDENPIEGKWGKVSLGIPSSVGYMPLLLDSHANLY